MADMPPQAAGPAPEGAAPQEGGGSPSESLQKLVVNIADGLAMLTDVVGSAGLSPEVAQGFGALNEQFKGLVQTLMQPSEEGAPPPEEAGAPQAVSPREAGGGKAIPAGMMKRV